MVEDDDEGGAMVGIFGSDDPIVLRRYVVGCVFLETTNNGDAKSRYYSRREIIETGEISRGGGVGGEIGEDFGGGRARDGDGGRRGKRGDAER